MLVNHIDTDTAPRLSFKCKQCREWKGYYWIPSTTFCSKNPTSTNIDILFVVWKAHWFFHVTMTQQAWRTQPIRLLVSATSRRVFSMKRNFLTVSSVGLWAVKSAITLLKTYLGFLGDASLNSFLNIVHPLAEVISLHILRLQSSVEWIAQSYK